MSENEKVNPFGGEGGTYVINEKGERVKESSEPLPVNLKKFFAEEEKSDDSSK